VSTQDDSMKKIKKDYEGFKEQVLNKELSELKTAMAVIEERSKKLEELDETLDEIKEKMPREERIALIAKEVIQQSDLATKEHVQSELQGTKLWILITAIGTGLTFLGTATSIVRLFLL
jgi:molybdopterin biosynthesis enzyme MoaB